MRKFLFVLSLLCGLSFTAYAQKPWDNGHLEVSSNSSFLQFSNGKPFFWLGDTGWLLPERLDRNEVQYYLQRCKEAGFNIVQIQVMNDVPTYNIYGQPSLIDGWNFSDINRKGVYGYWDHLDYIISVAEKNGIYIGMVPIWGSVVKAGKLDAQQAKLYSSFLATRYKKRPNIIWIMGGDIQGNIHPEVWDALATTIKSIDNNHIMTYHPRGRYTSARWWSKASWIDLHTFQSGHRKYGQSMGDKYHSIPDSTEEDSWMYVDSTWKYKPIRPVLDDEPSYEDIPMGLHDSKEPHWQACDVRRYAYWSVFAGSCGHSYGHNSIMQMLKPGYTNAYGLSENTKTWYMALDDPGFNQMKYLKQLMLSLPYFDRVPDQSIIKDNGIRYNRLIATRGRDYLLVYNYNSRNMRIDMTKISGSMKNIWWYDVSSGRLTYIGSSSDKTFVYNPLRSHSGICDGVLIAIDSSKKYIAKDQNTFR